MTSKQLKIYAEKFPGAKQPSMADVRDLPDFIKAFEEATGWSLGYRSGEPSHRSSDCLWSTPVNPGVGASAGHLTLEAGTSDTLGHHSPIDKHAAQHLASATAGMLGQMMDTGRSLWQREAELAAGVPLVPRGNDEKHLAEQLEAVLRGGAMAIGCQAAALYMLDEATTELKLRSAWGLPSERYTAPARPLRDALADLEAMLGHAIVLEDTHSMQRWNPPEDFASAVCVPIASSTTILGTLWMFCDEPRDFGDRQTNVVEIVAGRLAADLEREMLLHESIDSARMKRQLAAGQRLQRGQLPAVAPLLDDWDIAGWTAQAGPMGGDFFDWFSLGDGLLAVAAGDAMDQGIEAAMAANTIKASLRSHGQHYRRAGRLLTQVNRTVWTGSAGDQYATIFCGIINSATGLLHYASAGHPGVLLLGGDGWKSAAQPCPPLGESPETEYRQRRCRLNPGEAMVVFTDGFRDARAPDGTLLGEAGLAELLSDHLHQSAERLVQIARERLEGHTADTKLDDRTILVIRRR